MTFYTKDEIRRDLFMTKDCSDAVLLKEVPEYRSPDIRGNRGSPGTREKEDRSTGASQRVKQATLMTVTGKALAMRLQLRSLMQKHGVTSPIANKLPLFDECDHPMFMAGYASTNVIDSERTKFRPFCFGYLPFMFRNGYPPLLLKHQPDQVAGKIDTLQYDEWGSLQCWATVTDPMAKRMPAFSIAATVKEFSIVNEDTPNFFALITSASINEVSLTASPSNPSCLVHDRNRVSPHVTTLELIKKRVQILQKMTAHLKELNHG